MSEVNKIVPRQVLDWEMRAFDPSINKLSLYIMSHRLRPHLSLQSSRWNIVYVV